MGMAGFDYAAPEHLTDVVELLTERDGARVLAGGHTLVPDMKLGRTAPLVLVDLRNVRALRGIRRLDDGTLRIGAMCTLEEIAAHPGAGAVHALAEAIAGVGDLQVRNRATLGGSLVCATVGADLPPVAVALEGVVNVAGPQGRRTIPADGFFLGPSETALERGEIVTSLDVASSRMAEGSAYEKVENPASHYAVCGVAARVVGDLGGSVTTCRVVVTGATDRPTRLLEVEEALEGQDPAGERVLGASRNAPRTKGFFSDGVASREYREHLTTVLTERVLTRAIERAGFGKGPAPKGNQDMKGRAMRIEL